MMSDLDQQQDYYAKIGFSERIGFGSRPAVLVIDMCRGITEAGNPMYIDMDEHIRHINAILDAAHAAVVPVIFFTVEYHPDLADGGWFVRKIPLVQGLLVGSDASQIDPRLAMYPSDHLIKKKFPSGFYGTHLQSLLAHQGVDTTIVVGNSTSGCVRATAIDAISGGFRPIVPRDCVADRAPLSHAVNLFDIDSKYGDVVSAAEVIAYLQGLAPAAGKRAAG
jgi:maleamate amidohydrolase